MKSAIRPTVALLLCFAVAAFVPTASSAKVKTKSFSGTVSGGGTISFEATIVIKKVRHKGHVKRTVKITSILPGFLHDVPITCTEGSTSLAYGFPSDPIKVKQRSFDSSFTDTHDGMTVFSGKFNKKGKRASGAFRYQADFPPDVHNCDTGTVHWSAARISGGAAG